MDFETAKKILESVKSAYEQIAPEFATTRQTIWSGLKVFLEYIHDGDKILDAGCGNGRLLQLFEKKNIQYFGCDANEKLIAIAKKSHPLASFDIGNLLQLPYKDNFFDAEFCIAAFHHIPGRELRKRALLEMKRVLRPGGIMIVTSWYFLSERYRKYFLKNIALKLFGKSELDFLDAMIPWGGGPKRYYHLMTRSEARALVKGADMEIIKLYHVWFGREKNLVIIAKKV